MVETVQVQTEEDEQQERAEVVEEINIVQGFEGIECADEEREILQQLK